MINYKFIIDGEIKEVNAEHNGIFMKLCRENYPKFKYIKPSNLNLKQVRI